MGPISRYALLVLAIAALLPDPNHSKPSLDLIPTHHGINLDTFHINEQGGAVATRRHGRKRNHPSRPRGVGVAAATSDPSVSASTSHSLAPKKKTKNAAGGIRTEAAPRAAVFETNPRKQREHHQDCLTPAAITSMSLLALQFGIQPILVRRFTPQAIVRSSVVLVQEVVKFGIAGTIYFSGTAKASREKDFEGWSIKTWIALAGLPSFLYTIQNMAALMAYQNLEPLTFNVLNQTKILTSALSCYFVMGRRQSKMQVVSLCILILSTLVIEQILCPSTLASLFSFDGGARSVRIPHTLEGVTGAFKSLRGAGRRVTHGVVPILLASLISGLAGALTQKNLQGSTGGASILTKRRSIKTQPASRPPRNAYLFSMEMNVASTILLLASLVLSSSGRTILRSGTFFSNWTPETFIPVVTNSIGGILVGLVTKHAGSVRKGFALIFGLLLSGIFQAGGAGIRAHQIAGGLLAAMSVWIHTVYLYRPAPYVKVQKDA